MFFHLTDRWLQCSSGCDPHGRRHSRCAQSPQPHLLQSTEGSPSKPLPQVPVPTLYERNSKETRDFYLYIVTKKPYPIYISLHQYSRSEYISCPNKSHPCGGVPKLFWFYHYHVPSLKLYRLVNYVLFRVKHQHRQSHLFSTLVSSLE